MTIIKSVLVLVLLASLQIAFLAAAAAQDIYKDKTLTFIVGYSPGGTYDQYTRLLARHIGKYLPGNPTRIVENMPGAGGIIASSAAATSSSPSASGSIRPRSYCVIPNTPGSRPACAI